MDTDAIIIGAGPAGLATAACLGRRGVRFELLERTDEVGHSWRHHYQRLHLHTSKKHSALPFSRWPESAPTYPPRAQVVDYLDAYARAHHLQPRFGVEVTRVAPAGGGWRVEAVGDEARTARHVVMATGYNRIPRIPSFPGREAFGGRVMHSREYGSGRDFAGQRVLVIGSGNSGAEIALDLCEQGAKDPAICIRGPINVVPRDLLGIPAQSIGLATRWQPAAVTDRTMRILSWLVFGDLTPWGIERKAKGPLRQILEEGSIPLIDVGTIARIKSGQLRVVPAVERFTESGVRFVDGKEHPFDVVVLATGYGTDLEQLLAACPEVLDGRGYPRVHPPRSARPGLHFVGFANVATGLLREIALHAEHVADAIARGA